MQMADAPSEPGAVLRVGRDRSVCRLVTPDDWLFVSRVHLEFRCGPDAGWQLTWLRGSQADPSSEVRLVVGEHTQPVPYGGTVALPRAAAARSSSRTAPVRAASTSASTTSSEPRGARRAHARTRATAKPS